MIPKTKKKLHHQKDKKIQQVQFLLEIEGSTI